MHRVPAFVIASAAFCGTLAAASAGTFELALAAAVAVATLWAARRMKYSAAIFAVVAVAMAAWTIYLTPPRIVSSGTASYTVVARRVQVSDVGQNIIAITPDGTRLRLRVADVMPQIMAGDSLAFRAELLPVGASQIPYTAMTAATDRADRIAGRARVMRSDVRITGHSNAFIYRCDAMRRRLADAIYASPLSPAASRTLVAATLGTGDADPRLKEQFRATGLSHLLCVSGFHVGVVAMVISVLLSPLVLIGAGRRRHLLALVIVWVYAAIAGFAASVVRAAVMITVFYLSRLLDRRHEPFNALCLAFAAVLAIDPYQLFSAGFQLSFSAVTALLVFTYRLRQMSDHRTFTYRILNVLVPPAAAMAGTLPVMLVWFHRVPLLSVPFNVVGIAVFPIFMICGVAGVALWYVVPAGKYICLATNRIYSAIERFLDVGADIAGRYCLTYAPGTGTLIALIILVVALALVVNMRSSMVRRGAVAAAMLSVVFVGCSRRQDVGTHFIIDGDSRGSDIHVVASDRAATYVTTASGYATTQCHNFFDGLGLDADCVDVLPAGTVFDTAFGRVGVARRNTDYNMLADCDFILIAGKLKEPLADLLPTWRTPQVIIGANIPLEHRRRYAAACRRAATACHSIPDDGPYYLTK